VADAESEDEAGRLGRSAFVGQQQYTSQLDTAVTSAVTQSHRYRPAQLTPDRTRPLDVTGHHPPPPETTIADICPGLGEASELWD